MYPKEWIPQDETLYFWQKYILRGKSENHGTKVEMKMWFRNGLQMFQTSEIHKLDASYFNIVLTGDYDVTIQSKNTGHFFQQSMCTDFYVLDTLES